MKKLTLDLDALAVESFAAAGGEGEGTVQGREMMLDTRRQDSCYRTACCPDTAQPGCTA